MNCRLLVGISYQQFQLHSRNLSKHLHAARFFHSRSRVSITKPFLLADIGEGITECEITQWFVEPEARVEEWDKICEVTSDKASVEITSRFSGVIKKLHYEPGDMVKVGKPLVDIDIPSDPKANSVVALNGRTTPHVEEKASIAQAHTMPIEKLNGSPNKIPPRSLSESSTLGNLATLATPAVRHLTKKFCVKLEEISGTGKDGRVLKEDVLKFVKERDASPSHSTARTQANSSLSPVHAIQVEMAVTLTKPQQIMFNKMTKSLSIPHFLYADEIDFTKLSELRERVNKGLAKTSNAKIKKLTFLPFVIKAVSISLQHYPILNARVDHDDNTGKPFLTLRSQHNIGVAIDTPSGLLVPVIKNVSSLTVLDIASELMRLQDLALSGKLSGQDLNGGTITVSNIGSIGGTYVSPVIVEKETAILGIGKIRTVPAFSDSGNLIQKKVCNFSWSADHRVIDGATMARAGEVVRELVENPDNMMLHLH